MPRYWDARKLYSLMVQYGSSLPDLLKSTATNTPELATALGSGGSASDCIPAMTKPRSKRMTGTPHLARISRDVGFYGCPPATLYC